MRRQRRLKKGFDVISDTLFYLASRHPSKRWESQLDPVSYLPLLCEHFMHCMPLKKTPNTYVRHLNCFSDFCAVPWRTCSQNIWSKKIYLHLMWSSVRLHLNCSVSVSVEGWQVLVPLSFKSENCQQHRVEAFQPSHLSSLSIKEIVHFFLKEYISKFKLLPGKFGQRCPFASFQEFGN